MTIMREPRTAAKGGQENSVPTAREPPTARELNVAQHIADAVATIDLDISVRKETIARLQHEISRLQVSREALISAAQALPTQEMAPNIVARPGSAGQRTKRIRANSRAEAVRLAVEKILRAANRPMQRGELHEHIRAAGIVLPGDHPEKKLSKIMSNAKDRFINTGEGYWLADAPIPRAG